VEVTRFLLTVLVLSPGIAHATDCPVKYPLAQFAADLGAMQSSLRSLDEGTFKAVGKNLQTGMPCMAQAAPTPVYATAYRMLGAWEYIQGNAEKADGWFLTAEELDPAFTWDVKDFDVGHPVRTRYEDLKKRAANAPVPIPDVHLSPPAGSTFLIDGRPLTTPAATTQRPHLVQQVTGDKTVRAAWLIEGNKLPDVILQPGEEVAPVAAETAHTKKGSENDKVVVKDSGKSRSKKGDEATTSQASVVVVSRQRPPMKTPLIILGAVGVGASAATYAASWSARQKFDEAVTTDEINQYASTTNTFVMASGGLALVGLGLGYWGVLLDGGIGLGVVSRF